MKGRKPGERWTRDGKAWAAVLVKDIPTTYWERYKSAWLITDSLGNYYSHDPEKKR